MIARYLFTLALGAALVAGTGRAGEDPPARTADLADLKAAIAAADKRGENVGAIRDALAALEKALTKGAAKPGEAPPELVALREAVELAVRKGENVEGVAKELGRVEKALTGREYERPKPPEPKFEPEPQFPVPPRRPGMGGFGGPGRVVIAPAGGGVNSTSITVSNGSFTIKARQGDVNYLITGQTNGAEAPKIAIQDGEKKIETEDIKKVPDDYRPTVEKLLKMVTR